LSLVHPPSAETAPAARSGFGAGVLAGRLRPVLPASRHGFSDSPMSQRPGGRRDCVRMPARAPRKAPAGQGRPTGAAVTLQAPRRSLGGPPERQEAPTGRAGRQRPPIRSHEVATARQGARRRHEAGQGARGRPFAPMRSLQPARAPGGATRRGGRPEAAQCLPGGRHIAYRLDRSVGPEPYAGLLSLSAALTCVSVVHIRDKAPPCGREE
jgi:hypothetical protein